jgi:endonuclease/exonuclease/phosphatase family metal-dependent hydrolase
MQWYKQGGIFMSSAKHAATRRRLPLLVRILLGILLVLVLLVGGYLIYYFTTYYRIEDNLVLDVTNASTEDTAQPNTTYTIGTWNLGFGAYSVDYSFFMDGGTESRARSAEEATSNIEGAASTMASFSPDFVFFQEVDVDSTRAHHVNEYALATSYFPSSDNVIAINFDSPYLFWPLIQPHGKSLSGIVTLSRFSIQSSLRRSLPIDKGLSRVVDLDRCYSISEINVSNGKKLYLINIHASAYSSEAETVPSQMKQLAADLEKYYANGENYVIVGGDFNQDLPGDSAEKLNGSSETHSWARAFDRSYLPDGFSVADYTQSELVPSCRDCDTGYVEGETFVICVDGFLVSDNVNVQSVEVQNEGFLYTDHNPVLMQFSLES